MQSIHRVLGVNIAGLEGLADMVNCWLGIMTSQQEVIMDNMFGHYPFINWITVLFWSNTIPQSSLSTKTTVSSKARSTPQITQQRAPGGLNEVRVHPLHNCRVSAVAFQLSHWSGPKVKRQGTSFFCKAASWDPRLFEDARAPQHFRRKINVCGKLQNGPVVTLTARHDSAWFLGFARCAVASDVCLSLGHFESAPPQSVSRALPWRPMTDGIFDDVGKQIPRSKWSVEKTACGWSFQKFRLS